MVAEVQEERMRVQQVETDQQRRLLELRGEVWALALRVGHNGDGDDGAALGNALNETVVTSDRVQHELVMLAARKASLRGHDHGTAERGARIQLGHMRAAWLIELRARFRRLAAETHRQAQRARNRADEWRAVPLFAIKHRFEFLADAFGTIVDVDSSDAA